MQYGAEGAARGLQWAVRGYGGCEYYRGASGQVWGRCGGHGQGPLLTGLWMCGWRRLQHGLRAVGLWRGHFSAALRVWSEGLSTRLRVCQRMQVEGVEDQG